MLGLGFGVSLAVREVGWGKKRNLAEAWAPDLADRYVIDSAEAAVGIATDLLREEFGAAVFTAQATILLDRIKYCMRGHEAAEVRRYTQRARWSSREAFVACRGHPRGQFRHRRPSGSGP